MPRVARRQFAHGLLRGLPRQRKGYGIGRGNCRNCWRYFLFLSPTMPECVAIRGAIEIASD
jgi:hypothetical protein